MTGNQLIENVRELGGNIAYKKENEGAEKVEQDIALLENEFADIRKLLTDRRTVFAECIIAWDNFDTTLKNLQNWESDIRKKVGT